MPSIGAVDKTFTITQTEQLAVSELDASGTISVNYYAPQSGDYAINVNSARVSGSNNGTYRLKIVQHGSDSDANEIANIDLRSYDTVEETYDCKLNVGEWVTVSITVPVGTDRDVNLVDIDVTINAVEDAKKAGIGSVFNIGQSLGINKYSDFLKAFLQLFCAAIEVSKPAGGGPNGIKGSVCIYTCNELYRRVKTGQFVDWTAKLIPNSKRTDYFKIEDYAQDNTIYLKENDNDGAADSMNITINNVSLAPEKDLFTIGFEAGRAVSFAPPVLTFDPAQPPAYDLTGCSVPTVNAGDETNASGWPTTMEYKGCLAHIGTMGDKYIGAEFKKTMLNVTGARQVQPTEADLMNFPLMKNAPLLEFRTRYYESIAKMLHNARRITAYFRFTALDIANLDLMTPVYLDMYGAYFYINKINNFGAEATTEVELIKL